MQRTLPASRDLAIDLTRVACVLLVVFVHLVLVGVGRHPDGSPLFADPVNNSSWVAPASWVAEIMPLFFVVGGFAARVGWDSARRRGESAGSFVRARLARLARPALPLYVFLALGLGLATLAGLDPALLSTIAVPVGSVLWFLGAYLLVQALAPWMISWHERAPWSALIVLLVAALTVDVVRLVVGIWGLGLGHVTSEGYGLGDELFGLPNVAFVWLFAQQVGFCLRDGWFSRLSTPSLIAIVVAGFAGVGALVWLGEYDPSMLSNQWPPTTPLAVLAVVQAALFTLFHPLLNAIMRTRPAQALVFWAGSRLMTIYLWHVTAIVALTGLWLILPIPMPLPGSAAWWWSRVPMLVAVFGVVWLISLLTAALERPVPEPRGRRLPPAITVIAVLAFVAPSVLISTYGLDLPLALLAVAGTLLSVFLIRVRPKGRASGVADQGRTVAAGPASAPQ